MDDNRDDIIFNSIFRNTLENAEINPAPGLDIKLMNRLGRKEFLHFIPRKFNIWYAGGILAATAALIMQLLTGSNSKELPIESVSDTLIIEQPVMFKSVPVKSEVYSSGTEREKIAGELKESSEPEKSEEADTRPAEKESIREEMPVKDGSFKKSRTVQLTTGDQNLRGTANIPADLIKASYTDGCVPLRVSFSINGLVPDSCRWNFGDGGSSSNPDTNWLFDIDGNYKVELTVFIRGTMSVSYVIVTVYPRPEARFEIQPVKARLPHDEISFLNYSTGASDFRWDFGDGSKSNLFEPKHRYKQFDNYNVSLTAISSAGCSDTMVIKNAFGGSSYYISFPNAFIPNPDGPSGGYYSQSSDESASVFHPSFSGIDEYQLSIYTRRGILVFESNDVSIGWDGYYKGQLSDAGVYIWKARGSFINGETFTKMGDIMLIKN